MSAHSHRSARSLLLAQRAHSLREGATLSELRLWSALRGRQLNGVAFRRQQVLLGRFIVDFLAPQHHLAVEIDGGYHAERLRADARRDRVLIEAGYRVLRLPAELVIRELPTALALIRRALERCLLPPCGKE